MTRQKFLSNPGPSDMPATADIVVIGGGPAGSAALWAIERAAPGTRTILIEKSDKLGAGSSLASLENYRTCWPAPCMAAMMKRCVEVFYNADDFLGENAALSLAVKKRGYLFCGFNARQAESLKSDVTHLHKLGLTHVEFLDADEIRYRFPWLGAAVVAGKYDPVAGWLDSNALIYKYAQSAASAQIVLDVQHTAIDTKAGRVTGVTTSNGKIAAPSVIIAAGAGAVPVGRSAGVELPVILRPRQSFTTSWRHPEFPEDGPMLIAAAPHAHIRPEAQTGTIFGWEYRWNTRHIAGLNGSRARDSLVDPIYPVEQLKDPRFPSLTLMALARQFGHRDGHGFADPRYLRGIHNIGYYAYRSPDAAYIHDSAGARIPYESERAIIDAVPGVDGLFASVAHVGHGIMSSPAAGEIIASKVLGLPLPDPIFADFGFAAHWVEHDANAL